MGGHAEIMIVPMARYMALISIINFASFVEAVPKTAQTISLLFNSFLVQSSHFLANFSPTYRGERVPQLLTFLAAIHDPFCSSGDSTLQSLIKYNNL